MSITSSHVYFNAKFLKVLSLLPMLFFRNVTPVDSWSWCSVVSCCIVKVTFEETTYKMKNGFRLVRLQLQRLESRTLKQQRTLQKVQPIQMMKSTCMRICSRQ
jgi:hypothetical protein